MSEHYGTREENQYPMVVGDSGGTTEDTTKITINADDFRSRIVGQFINDYAKGTVNVDGNNNPFVKIGTRHGTSDVLLTEMERDIARYAINKLKEKGRASGKVTGAREVSASEFEV